MSSDKSLDTARSVAPRAEKAHSPLVHRYLDPSTALAEVLFGLIMTLTFTLSAGIIIEDEGREGARALLIAVIGCNIAWGIIDAALYLVGQLFDRGHVQRLGRAIRAAPDRTVAGAVVASELNPLLADVLGPRDAESLYARIADNVIAKPASAPAITKEDWLGGLKSFVLVVVSSIPAAVPFLLIDNARLALRVSNAVLLALLFLTGYWWARYMLTRPWLVGLAFLVIGVLLVLAAIALGG